MAMSPSETNTVGLSASPLAAATSAVAVKATFRFSAALLWWAVGSGDRSTRI
jgi:hypothetical protein